MTEIYNMVVFEVLQVIFTFLITENQSFN